MPSVTKNRSIGLMFQIFQQGNILAPNEDFYLGIAPGTAVSLVPNLSLNDRFIAVCNMTNCNYKCGGWCFSDVSVVLRNLH